VQVNVHFLDVQMFRVRVLGAYSRSSRAAWDESRGDERRDARYRRQPRVRR
jgi:hypothetical protein